MLLDTSALIELFTGGSKAGEAKKLIEGKPMHACILTLTELKLWALRNNVDPAKYLTGIEENLNIIDLTKEIALLAAEIRFNAKPKDFGLIDALIYATAQTYGLTVVSKDKHFAELKNTIII